MLIGDEDPYDLPNLRDSNALLPDLVSLPNMTMSPAWFQTSSLVVFMRVST
jgi:hypothetical protein